MGHKKELKKIYIKLFKNQTSKREGNDIPYKLLHKKRSNASFFFGAKVLAYPKLKRSFDGGRYKQKYISGDKSFFIGKSRDEDGHILVVGGAGSGKSSCIVMPTLETWGGAIFAIDIKGELVARWNDLKKSDKNRPVKIFNLTNIESANDGIYASYDPFQFLNLNGEDNLAQNAKEIAQSIIPLSPDIREPFWIQSAQNVLTGALLYGYGLGASFNETLTRILTAPIWELIEEISESDNTIAKLHISQFSNIDKPSENRMLTGISAELNSKILTFTTSLRVKDLFADTGNHSSWEDLETHNIFMTIAEDKLGQWDGAISMMLTQLIRTLERRPDKHSPEGKDNTPILLLLDEFPRLGKVDIIQNAVSTLRSKGVTICIVIQSLAQLDRVYGKESRQIILDNCQYKAILNVSDPESQRLFSDMIGSIIVRRGGVSINAIEGDEDDGIGDFRVNYNEAREPLMFPHKLATLKDIVLITSEGFCRVDKIPYFLPTKANSEKL